MTPCSETGRASAAEIPIGGGEGGRERGERRGRGGVRGKGWEKK